MFPENYQQSTAEQTLRLITEVDQEYLSERQMLFYLCSPYTYRDSPDTKLNLKIQEARAQLATKVTVLLLKRGMCVFSPIAYNHPMVADGYDLPTNWTFWKNIDMGFLDRCDGVLVLMLPGWDESIGVREEIEFARFMNKQVYYIPFSTLESPKIYTEPTD